MSLTVYYSPDGVMARAIHGPGADYDTSTRNYDWSDDNPPWAYPAGLSASLRG